MLLLILIGFFALVGFAVSGYIFLKKQKHEKLVCFVGDDCNAVINSKYNSLFFGIPNEVLGLGYYAAVFAGVVLLFLGVRYLGPIPFVPACNTEGSFVKEKLLRYLVARARARPF